MQTMYSSKNPVAVRIPLSSIDRYKDLFNNEDQLIISDGFKEAILVASGDLYYGLSKNQSNKKYAEIKRAVLKYQIRGMTRCTPYGLFAGIGMAKYAQKTNLNFDESCTAKRARVDMKWLFKYIDLLLQTDDIVCSIRIKRNRQCYKNGDRFINPYFSAGGKAKGDESLHYSIRYTKPVQFILDTCEKYIGYLEILNQLVENFGIQEDRAKGFLNELIHHEFLLIELFPPLINTDSTDYLIHILENSMVKGKHSQYLRELNRKIEDYNKCSLGEGIEKFLEITDFMRSEIEAKDFLQIDTKINFINQGISSMVGQEIERVVNMITMLAAGNSPQIYITEYKKDFVEKYGYNTEIPILEMLDNNMGIGVPANYKNSLREYVEYSNQNKLLDHLNHIIINRGINAIEKNVGVVELNDDDFNKVCKDSALDHNCLLNSVDIFAQLLASSTQAIDEGDFSLLLSGCFSSAGGLNSLGRFSDMFWNDSEYDKEIIAHEQELLGKDYVIAELVQIFRTGRTANVDMNMNSLDYQICIGCNGCDDKKEINIDDIYIGIDVETKQFYAKSYDLNKKIYARTTHMLNSLFGSNPYRFLRDISSLATKFQFGGVISSIGANDFEYFPRVTYGKTILRPARWRYEYAKGKDFDEWDHSFMKWANDHKVPGFVNYIKSDNFLRLDLRRKKCRELLYFDSLKDEFIILNEDFTDDSNLWLKDTHGNKYCCEMVFTLDKKNILGTKDKFRTNSVAAKKSFNDENGRIFFPGENGWYFFKLYGMSERENEFIGEDLKCIADYLMKEKVIDQHFFIRYFDERKHIRVRFHVKTGMDNRFISVFQNWLIEERERGIVTDLNVAVYEREVERYGGHKLITIAEKVFMADSIFVESLREALYYGDISLTDDCIAIWSINGLMEGFGKNIEEAEEWLSLSIKRNEYRDIFKKNEMEFRNCLCIKEREVPPNVMDAYNIRNKEVYNFYYEINAVEKQGMLTNTVGDILSSLIHMFCNRYMADNEWERRVRALTRHTLYATLSYNRFHKKDE